MYKATIPMKLPFFNEYLVACKTQKGKWNLGNQIKQDTEEAMQYYLKKLPKLEKPIRINFNWICPRSDKHDLDNIAFRQEVYIRCYAKS